MPLYGNELDLDDHPLRRRTSAGSSSSARPGDFVGRAALERVAADGPSKRLVGLVVEGRGIARHGYAVHVGDRRDRGRHQRHASRRPWACRSRWPTSRRAISQTGTMVDVEVRDARVPARVVDLPFYRRPA